MIVVGDAKAKLAELDAGSVQCMVTSPPYYGLRDYETGSWEGGDPDCEHEPVAAGRGAWAGERTLEGSSGPGHVVGAPHRTARTDTCRCGARLIDGQLGLEPEPADYVARIVDVFEEVRRVLRDDGVAWLNLGDTYASRWPSVNGDGRRGLNGAPGRYRQKGNPPGSYKPKDQMGIPWQVAQALQAPRYLGSITAEIDRVWLAAMIDGEGCIFLHRRKAGSPTGRDGHATKADGFQPGLSIGHTSERLLERCVEITGMGRVRAVPARDGNRPTFEWRVYGRKARSVLAEVYPHLVVKGQEARLALDCPPSGARGLAAWEALKALHAGSESPVDGPEPAALWRPGWYLRADVVWHKPNALPESVRDRPSRAHEYLFLLAKQRHYYYDPDAIRERGVWGASDVAKIVDGRDRQGGHYANDADPKTVNGAGGELGRKGTVGDGATRNARTVWSIPTQPYREAHFATFPPALAEKCVLAGSPPCACSACGAPHRRIVERTSMVVREGPGREGLRAAATGATSRTAVTGTMIEPPTVRTVGWEPTCACGAPTRPAVVLDPFAGAGTVGVVCGWHGREFVGVELNPDYAAMAERRILRDGRPSRRKVEPVVVSDDQLTLLA